MSLGRERGRPGLEDCVPGVASGDVCRLRRGMFVAARCWNLHAPRRLVRIILGVRGRFCGREFAERLETSIIDFALLHHLHSTP